ncbi:hypothetical protein R4L22_11990 [Brachyspira pilosicoli]|uniref:hypothetical protein n=1 Tax=Brachyspira pilosicoli TaxID=52584 RepID=UPI0012F515C3|nr:hypothetical protein [Brachyspira pilosicoli]
MKAKIFLIIMIILFAVSCANNNPANPVQNNNETKNTENNANSGNTSGNSGNTSSNNNGGTEINNHGDKISIDSLDGIVEYGGKGQLNIKLLDGIHAVGPEDIQVYVDIYEEDKIASVHARGLFNFDNIKLDNNKNTYYSSDYKGNYTLTMRFGKDSITDFQVIIHFNGDNYKYYVTADKLEKIRKN